MRLMLVLSACVATLPVFSETLSEAVQHSLILNPEVLFSATTNVAVDKSRSGYSPTLNLNSAYGQKKFVSSSIFNALKLNSYDVKNLKTQILAEDLALEVSKYFLKVLLQDKLLQNAQVNLRVNRAVFLLMKDKRQAGKISQREFEQVSKRLAIAESQQIHAEMNLKAIKTSYAKVVGSWPSNLSWPRLPSSKELPTSVGDAIEQGLDNYTLSTALNNKQKNRSMAALSEKVRLSWNDWTKAGLEVIRLRKQVASFNEQFVINQNKFKAGKSSWLTYLNAQERLYKEQIILASAENKEAYARFQILNTVGKLINYINLSENEDENTTLSEVVQAAPELDKIDLPYPNYKPHFQGVANPSTAPTAGNSNWYVSAGKFKNKANALALVNKLKDLGFIVFSETHGNVTAILVGPYEYPGHAAKGMERLKEIAHVQGVLVNTKQPSHYG